LRAGSTREPSSHWLAQELAVASTDAGLTWNPIAPPPTGASILAAWVSSAGDVWLGGTLAERPLLLHGQPTASR
jgi:hypothetical protein